MKTKINHLWWLFLFQFFWLIITSCNPVFEPLDKDHNYYFSIYGYLDASADTNWLRITPVRDQLFLETEEVDAVVTLENLATGEREVMKDSVFHYEGTPAHNFWTTMNIEPAQTYRITARNSRFDSSYVDVILPDDFPTPLVVAPPDFFSAFSITIHIEGVEHLADARTFHQIQRQSADRQQIVSFSHMPDTSDAVMPPGEHRIWFQPPHILRELRNRFTDPFHFTHQQLYIASAGLGSTTTEHLHVS